MGFKIVKKTVTGRPLTLRFKRGTVFFRVLKNGRKLGDFGSRADAMAFIKFQQKDDKNQRRLRQFKKKRL